MGTSYPTKLGESDPVRPIIAHALIFCWEVGGLDGFGPVFWCWLSDGLLRRPHRDGAMGASANNAAHPEKINAIEIGEQVAGETPTREDLLENDFSSYRVVPGDVITVTAFDVYQPGQPVTVDRVVDQSGFVQLPEIGLVKVEGLLPEELSPSIRSAYGRLLGAPQVDAALVLRTGFRFTINGFISQPNVYPLLRSDLRLLEALSQAGGILDNAQYAIVRRRVQLEGSLESNDLPDSQDPLDLDGLLDRLEGKFKRLHWREEDTFVDIDLLSKDTLPEVQAPEDLPASPWQWDMDSGSWRNMAGSSERSIEDASGSPVFIDRVLRIPLQQLRRGDSNLDIVIPPGGLHLGGTGWRRQHLHRR